MQCSICGQAGAWFCDAHDEFGTGVGEWKHAICACQAKDYSSIETQSLRSTGYSKVFKIERLALPRMRGQGRQIRIPVRRRLLQSL